MDKRINKVINFQPDVGWLDNEQENSNQQLIQEHKSMFGHMHNDQQGLVECEKGHLLADPSDLILSVSNCSKMTA